MTVIIVCVLDQIFPPGYAKFVDKNGEEKPNDLQASQLVFDRKSEHMGKDSFN